MTHMRGWLTDAARLGELMLEADLTITQLAAASGLSVSMVGQVVNGARQLSYRGARKVADVLDCKVEDFCRRPTAPDEAAA